MTRIDHPAIGRVAIITQVMATHKATRIPTPVADAMYRAAVRASQQQRSVAFGAKFRPDFLSLRKEVIE